MFLRFWLQQKFCYEKAFDIQKNKILIILSLFHMSNKRTNWMLLEATNNVITTSDSNFFSTNDASFFVNSVSTQSLKQNVYGPAIGFVPVNDITHNVVPFAQNRLVATNIDFDCLIW